MITEHVLIAAAALLAVASVPAERLSYRISDALILAAFALMAVAMYLMWMA